MHRNAIKSAKGSCCGVTLGISPLELRMDYPARSGTPSLGFRLCRKLSVIELLADVLSEEVNRGSY